MPKWEPNDMEKRLKVEDRGPVDPFNDGALRWVVSCARCMHTAHIVIVQATGERKYACPRCLVFLNGSPNPPSPGVKRRESWAEMEAERKKMWEQKHPAIKNRIRRYL